MDREIGEQGQVVCRSLTGGGRVCDNERLRDRTGVFTDRSEGGRRLAPVLLRAGLAEAQLMAIPAGGVPVALTLSEALGCPLDVAVVSKVTLPWNSEAGIGAVAFDGGELLNHDLIRSVGLTERDVEEGLCRTREKVDRRVGEFRRERPLPDLANRPVVIVDDGLASGFTMRVAVEALRRAGAREMAVAVPTGHADSVLRLAAIVGTVCCANIRSGTPFAVASAYRQWTDVPEEEAVEMLRARG